MDREAIARIIGSFVVYDDHGGPDTEVLADRIAATHDAAYDALMGLADQILALTPPPGAGGIAEAAAQLAGLQLGWKLGLRGDDEEYRLTFERWSAEIAAKKPELVSTGPRVTAYRSRAADLRTLLSAVDGDGWPERLNLLADDLDLMAKVAEHDALSPHREDRERALLEGYASGLKDAASDVRELFAPPVPEGGE